LEILRKASGPDQVGLANAEVRLGFVYQQQSKYVEAERLFLRALPILERTYPNGHTELAVCLHGLAETERLQHRYPAAESNYRRAIQMYERAGGGAQRQLAIALQDYARLLRTNRIVEARALERRAKKLQETVRSFQ
jgi:tetratricopeptide (TPR) repeat protein